MSPRVTVLIAVHNGGSFLPEAIASVLAQTYGDFELLLVDDASTDDALAALPADDRIRVLRNEVNLGQIPSLNHGLREARGELVARLDHDDLCLPTRLERQVALFDSIPRLALAATWVDVVDESGRLWGRGRPRVESYERFAADVVTARLRLAHPSIMFRRDTVLELGGFDERLGAAEDQELYRRLALARAEVRVVPETLVHYRRHAGQMTVEHAQMVEQNDALSHERFLADLAPEAPARTLRLLFRGDPAFWEEPPISEADLAGFVGAATERLGLTSPATLERAVADAAARAVVAAWSRGVPIDPGHREPLERYAGRHGGATGRALPLVRASGPAGRGLAHARARARDVLASEQLDAARRAASRSRALRWVYARIVARSSDH